MTLPIPVLIVLSLLTGFVLDLLLGDPRKFPHIIRGFGAVVGTLGRLLYPIKNKRLGGCLLVALTLFFCAGVPAVLLYFTYRVSVWAYFVLESLLCWQLLAVKSLRTESDAVYRALLENDIEKARRAVSMIVGRDTQALDAAGVTRAAVETVAENTADGVISPLFYLMFGAVFGCLYKAVNTMDSMIGYKNERYIDFGRCAAKLDDALNYIPSRFSALLLIFSARILGLDAKNALFIWRRDRRKHASPNSAQTESAVAGALRIRLAGNAYYFGKLCEKTYIGDDTRPIEPEDIRRAHRLLYMAAFLMLPLALLVRWCLYAAL